MLAREEIEVVGTYFVVGPELRAVQRLALELQLLHYVHRLQASRPYRHLRFLGKEVNLFTISGIRGLPDFE